MPKFVPRPVAYSVYKRILGRYNDLYSLWQQTITENSDLEREVRSLRQQLQTSAIGTARPARIRPVT
jgi:DNA-binding winged helix-turn-helix (wHTH) protein